MPEPIIEPATIMVESSRPSSRTKPPVSTARRSRSPSPYAVVSPTLRSGAPARQPRALARVATRFTVERIVDADPCAEDTSDERSRTLDDAGREAVTAAECATGHSAPAAGGRALSLHDLPPRSGAPFVTLGDVRAERVRVHEPTAAERASTPAGGADLLRELRNAAHLSRDCAVELDRRHGRESRSSADVKPDHHIFTSSRLPWLRSTTNCPATRGQTPPSGRTSVHRATSAARASARSFWSPGSAGRTG